MNIKNKIYGHYSLQKSSKLLDLRGSYYGKNFINGIKMKSPNKKVK